MKKILLIAVAVFATFTANAKVFSDNLIIQVNDIVTDPFPTDVNVDFNEDGTMNFSLNNFWFMLEGDAMFVGNIVLNNVALTLIENSDPAVSTFEVNEVIHIAPGTGVMYEGEFIEVPESDWVGPLLEDVPIEMTGQISDDKVYVKIDINMVKLEQIIHVTYSTPIDYTIVDAIRPVSFTGQQGISYDLSGRRMTNKAKGISVVNGKKILVNK